MSFDRTNIFVGPAIATYDSATIFSEGDVVVQGTKALFNRRASGLGVVARRVGDKRVTVRIKPAHWANLNKLYPYAGTQVGASLFGATDKPLVINPLDGSSKITIVNAVITKMGDITLSLPGSGDQASQIGEIEFTGLVAKNADPALQASFFTFATADGSLSAFALTQLLDQPYSASFNSVTYRSESGFRISFDMALSEKKPDGETTVDIRLKTLLASARFTPIGITAAEWATLLGFAGAVGSDPSAYTLTISGSSITVVLNNALVESAALGYGEEINRTGEVLFTTRRSQTAGVLDSLFSLTGWGSS